VSCTPYGPEKERTYSTGHGAHKGHTPTDSLNLNKHTIQRILHTFNNLQILFAVAIAVTKPSSLLHSSTCLAYSIRTVTTTPFAYLLYGQCCYCHFVGHQNITNYITCNRIRDPQNGTHKGKKVKIDDTWCSTSLRSNPDKGAQLWHALSRDRTVLPATQRLSTKCNEPYLLLPSQPKPVLIYRPRRNGVGLSTTMVSKQSVHDCYVTSIIVISCSGRHASLGNWKRSRLWASNSRPIGPKAAKLTTERPSQPALSLSKGLTHASDSRRWPMSEDWPPPEMITSG